MNFSGPNNEPWTTCADWHQNWFVHFQNIVFTSLVADNGQADNICLPLPASLAWQSLKI